MSTAREMERRKRLLAEAAKVSPEVRAMIASLAVGSQEVVENWPYYSRVRFQADVSVVPPTTFLTLAVDQAVDAFSYAVGGDMQAAGFPAGRIATLADTNLTDARKTKDGQTLYIQGISAFVVPLSEPFLAQAIWGQSDVGFNRDGADVVKKIGSLMFIPSAGGLVGATTSALAQPPLPDSFTSIGNMSNGWPVNFNFWRLPEEVIWTPSGKTDGSLTLRTTLRQAFAADATARAAAAGVAAFSPPTLPGQIGTFVEIMFLLHSTQSSRRGVNQ